MPLRPSSVNICGIRYTIEYVDSPANVDIHRRESLWGQIEYWTHSIRVYDNRIGDDAVWEALIHEILHGISANLHLKILQGDDAHDDLDVLALALYDVFTRNGWLTFDVKE